MLRQSPFGLLSRPGRLLGELPTHLFGLDNEGAGVKVVDPSAIAPFCLEPPEHEHYLVDAADNEEQGVIASRA